MVSIKEDGFASWLWRPKWLVLKEQTLSIHKTEVSTIIRLGCPGHLGLRGCAQPLSRTLAVLSEYTTTARCRSFVCRKYSFVIWQTAPQQSIIYLRDIANIERTDLKPYCLLLETKDKRYYLALKNDEELYGWQDDVYSRSPLMGVSNPTNFVHKVHVGFDPVSGAFTVSPTFL